jgi:membrane protein involved in colicin uptake
MKMLARVMMWAAFIPGAVVMAGEPAKKERKLEGDDLAKFYLQQVLDQADKEPIVTEPRDWLQELKDLVGRLEQRRQAQLAKAKEEADKRAAEKQAAEKKAAEKQAAARQAAADAEAKAKAAAGNPLTAGPLKPLVDHAGAAPAKTPPTPKADAAGQAVPDPAVRPAGAELPSTVGQDGSAEASSATEPGSAAKTVDTTANDATANDEDQDGHVRNQVQVVIVALDQVIQWIEALKAKLMILATLS